MAKDDTELNLDIEEPSGSSLKLVIIILVAVLVLGGIGAAVYFLLFAGDTEEATTDPAQTEQTEETPVKAPAQYVSIPQAFLANIQASNGRMRILQVKVELLVRSNEAFESAKHNVPLIQNTLRNVFSGAEYDSIRTLEGKEQLRVLALEKVQEVMVEETGLPTIEQVLFTDFVMQ